MEELAEVERVMQALSHKNRLRIVLLLRGGELPASGIAEILGVHGSTCTRHLAVLQRAGLVESQQEGAWVLYRRARLGRNSPLQQLVRWAERQLEEDARVVKDARAAEKMREQDRDSR